MINKLLNQPILKNFSAQIQKNYIKKGSVKPLQPLQQDVVTIVDKSVSKRLTDDLMDRTKTIYGESKNPKVIDIEKRLALMGVNVSFEDDILLAKRVTDVVEKLKAKGYDLPQNIFIMKPKKVELGGFCPTFTPKGTKSFICVSKKFKPTDFSSLTPEQIKNLEQLLKGDDLIKFRFFVKNGINEFSTNTQEGVIFHEIGHFLHRKTRLPLDKAQTVWEVNKIVNNNLLDLMKEVSYYAVSGSKDGSEFVAEVFAGLMSGKKYSNKVMELYNQLHGPKVM